MKDSERLQYMMTKVNKDGKVTKEELGPCWEISGSGNNGYIFFCKQLAHRESYRLHNNLLNIPEGLLVRHKCIGNRSCVNPNHLELGDKNDNNDDMIRDGTRVSITKKGYNNGNSKLTDEQVSEIRKLPRENQRDIAKEYGVSQAHIHRLQTYACRDDINEILDDKEQFFKLSIVNKRIVIEDLGDCWETKHARESRSYKNKKMKSHRIAYLYEHSSIPEGKQVNHKCDNEKCIRPSHLYAGTDRENKEDAKQRGRTATGSAHGMAKLSEENVIKIYKNIEGKSHTDLASEYNVSIACVSMIRNGKTWTHVISAIN